MQPPPFSCPPSISPPPQSSFHPSPVPLLPPLPPLPNPASTLLLSPFYLHSPPPQSSLHPSPVPLLPSPPHPSPPPASTNTTNFHRLDTPDWVAVVVASRPTIVTTASGNKRGDTLSHTEPLYHHHQHHHHQPHLIKGAF
ncbi:hypothetical protein Pcinc_034860 [Petrolisthes cinctipes]|uniref:Uncharacterized protein n=1 Tax=Petrolisthes cinctipes TaxID=88211 RepID=A0AAE1C0V3_PETCI|nr:hypothetical protein Pcinc_034860 [Petrolisthes cinctipes]